MLSSNLPRPIPQSASRVRKQVIISKPKKILRNSSSQKDVLEQEKPGWNERFVLEKIPLYPTAHKERISDEPATPGISGVQRRIRTQMQPPITPQSQMNSGLVNKSIVKQVRPLPYSGNAGSGISAIQRKASLNRLGGEKDENKYSSTPLVQHYLNMQEKPVVIDLESNPKLVDNYLDSLQQDINFEWQERSIPHFHRKVFSEAIKGLPKITILELVVKELKLLKRDRSQIQICLKVVHARELCLENLKGLIEELKGPIDEKQVKRLEAISETLKDLRILSLEAVEQILRWREFLLSLHQQKLQFDSNSRDMNGIPNLDSLNIQLPFYHNQRNYLLKMRDDIKFLQETTVKFHVKLSVTTISDPFLLTMQRSQVHTDPLYVDYPQITHDLTSLIPRIRASELIIFEESIQRRVKEQFGDYTVKQLDITEAQLPTFLSSYFDSIPQEIKNSFYGDIESITSQIAAEQEVNFLKITSGGSSDQIAGLAIICVDQTQYTLRRTNILHVSCIEKSFYNSIINTVVDFIWKNDSSEEIRVHLFYQDVDGKLQLDPSVKNIFNNIGFKWKQLVNDSRSGKRSTIFGLKRPAAAAATTTTAAPAPSPSHPAQPGNAPTLISQKSNPQQQQNLHQTSRQGEPIVFTTTLVLSEKVSRKDTIPFSDRICDTPFHFAKAALTFKEQATKDSLIPSNPIWSTIAATFSEQDINLKGVLIQKYIEDDQTLNRFCKQANPQIVDFNLAEEGQTVGCVTKSVYRWKCCTHVQHQEKDYVRIRKNIEMENIVKRCSISDNQDALPIYTIPTDDPSINVFIMKLAEANLNEVRNKEKGLSEILADVISKCDTQTPVEEDIWIPAFTFETNLHSVPTQESSSVRFNANQVSFGMDYKPQINAGLTPSEPTPETAILWEPPFVIGLIHNELDEKLDFPLLSCLIEE